MLLSSDHLHYLFDRALAPVLTVNAGAVVTFETLDACCGEVRSVEEFLGWRSSGRPSNPLTGPVFVSSAQPGHTLVVEILDVQLAAEGFQLIGPERGVVVDEVGSWTCQDFRAVDGRILFPNGISVPAAPVIGSFGNAPAGEPTFHANRLGGNVDVPAARTGAKLYIPVDVEGALFSLGDVHACQGDGEVVGAPEIGASVTVKLDLLEHRHSEWCMIEDAVEWHSVCAGPTEGEAARLAVLQNAQFIARTENVQFPDALILLTLIGRLTMARTGRWGNQQPVVCASFSKNQVRQAITGYGRGESVS